MTRDFHLPGRSPIYARDGMAATSHPLASIAAIDILKSGGSAADAAVAAVAVLCVVEPAMTGIGGDCFCLVAKPDKPVWGYNGSGRAGAAVTAEKLLAQGMGRKIPATSQHAIRYAEDGFPVAPRVASDWAMFVDKLKPHAGSVKHCLVNGKSPDVGSV